MAGLQQIRSPILGAATLLDQPQVFLAGAARQERQRQRQDGGQPDSAVHACSLAHETAAPKSRSAVVSLAGCCSPPTPNGKPL